MLHPCLVVEPNLDLTGGMNTVDDTRINAMTNNLNAPLDCASGLDHFEIATSSRCSLCEKDCPSRDVGLKLRSAGLRPTRQRVELARLLFGKGDQHVTAEMLHGQAVRERISVSLATVYNTLQQFTTSGLIRRLATDGHRTWFDTNTTDHHHLFYDEDNKILDVPEGYLTIGQLPPVPEGMEVDRVEVVVRLKRKAS